MGAPTLATPSSESYQRLRRLLDELFQFDQADLDFGIYRIMNQQRAEIGRFLDEDLLPQVRTVLLDFRAGEQNMLQAELDKLRVSLQAAGVSPESAPRYQELQGQLASLGAGSNLENEVYSDLYTFFRRYYKDGDFISLRRYKAGVYAIPYEGEEVKLHWANADQYYVKTTEAFQDYRFRLPDGRHAHFRLVAAETERDNNKATDEERRFYLREETPVAEIDGELHIRFEYRPSKEKQKNLNDQAVETLLGLPDMRSWREMLATPQPTASDKNRSLLAKHLNDYTAKNTFDYFIHKDLDGFLRRELNFFLKNEVAHLDDLDTPDERRADLYLARLRAIKRIGHKVIDFLAQFEGFQKRLFLKKKFVVTTDYCLTLDRLPAKLHESVIANDAQWAEWERLYSVTELPEVGNRVAVLASQPSLVLDTRFFDSDFKQALLDSVDDLDEELDGLLVKSENFQAMQLLSARYRGEVGCVMTDPPYNRKADDFPYKDNYKHSSWIAMMADRLALARELLSPSGVLFHNIDENEHVNASALLTFVFGLDNRVGDIVWKNSSKNDQDYVSMQHEYFIGAVKDKASNKGEWRERKEGLDEIYAAFDGFKRQYGTDWKAIHRAAREWYRRFPESSPIKDSDHYSWMDERGVYFAADISGPNFGQYRYDVLHPVTGKVCKEPASGWRYPETTILERIQDNRVHFGDDETTIPNNKTYLKDTERQSLTSIKYRDGRVASNLIVAMFGAKVFPNPKDVDLTVRLLRAIGPASELVVDVFAGSGTTGHALINLNREDGGRRKYVLVEMGEYFDSVLKPRVLKAIHSKDWRAGKPVSREGASHFLKYLTLESYEDALNNLRLRERPTAQRQLLDRVSSVREDYLLSYCLDAETDGSASLLDLERFETPFDYQLTVTQGGESRSVTVDLPETFNHLLGLRVKRVRTHGGFYTVEGIDPDDNRVLVIWRSLKDPATDNEALERFFTAQGYHDRPADEAFNLVYVNGDCTLLNLRPEGAS